MTSNEPNAEAAESAIRQIGAEFSRLRSLRGERIEDIAAYLDIRVTHLFAIEQGDLSVIPSKREAKTVLRSYANYLGLDGDGIVAPIDPILASLKDAKAPLDNRPKPSIDRLSVIILAASVILGVLVGWHWIGDSNQFSLLPAPIMIGNKEAMADGADIARVEEPVGEGSAKESGNDGASLAAAAATGKSTALLAEIKTVLSEPVIDQTRSLAADTGGELEGEQAKEERPANVLAALVAKRGDGAHIYEADNTDARVIVRAMTDVSVQVTSRGRDYAWTRTMKPKEMLLVPNRDDLELWTGDAGGIEILLDGKILPPLGSSGTVVSGLSLAPASLERVTETGVADDSAKPTF